MHELALSHGIVDLVLARARTERLRTVTRVNLMIGAAAGVDPDALRFCWDVVTEETPARGAELVITQVPLRARCRWCRREFDTATVLAPCPACGGSGVELVGGRELRVTSFDAE